MPIIDKKSRSLFPAFENALNKHPHLAMEVGYTRVTDWMVHVWDATGVGLKAAPKIICTQSHSRATAMRQAADKLNELFP